MDIKDEQFTSHYALSKVVRDFTVQESTKVRKVHEKGDEISGKTLLR